MNENELMEKSMDEVLNEKTPVDEERGIGTQVLEIRPETRVFVQNCREAEMLFDHIFKGKTSIEELLKSSKNKIEDRHFPVDTATHQFITQGDLIHAISVTPCRITLDSDEDKFDILTYLEEYDVTDRETGEVFATKPLYVYSIHILRSIAIQTYSDNHQDIIFFKDFCEDSVSMLTLG